MCIILENNFLLLSLYPTHTFFNRNKLWTEQAITVYVAVATRFCCDQVESITSNILFTVSLKSPYVIGLQHVKPLLCTICKYYNLSECAHLHMLYSNKTKFSRWQIVLVTQGSPTYQKNIVYVSSIPEKHC